MTFLAARLALPEAISMQATWSCASLVDIDLNLFHADFVDDIPHLRSEAFTSGVKRVVVPGCTLEDSRRAIALASTQTPDGLAEVFATAGWFDAEFSTF